MTFRAYVGVDQTGAVSARGAPRPLDAAVLAPSSRGEGRAFELRPARLAHASEADVAAALGRALDGETAIVLDAVLGLPEPCWPDDARGADAVWAMFARTHAFEGYGRAVAERFFAAVPRPDGPLPRRACEIAADANSVLASRPYQKNVQTGTFRVWKDLTRAPERWANLWPFEDAATARGGAPWLFEGYPSFLWSRVFGFPRRAPAAFADVVLRARAAGIEVRASSTHLAAFAEDADLADAAVLAIGAACLDHAGLLLAPFPGFSSHAARAREGWIVGVPG